MISRASSAEIEATRAVHVATRTIGGVCAKPPAQFRAISRNIAQPPERDANAGRKYAETMRRPLPAARPLPARCPPAARPLPTLDTSANQRFPVMSDIVQPAAPLQ